MILAIAIIPSNVLAIYKFYQKKLNKTFFILVTVLCICNFAMSILAILTALARYMDRHPLGIIGCYITSVGLCIITSITMFTQAIISYERRKVLTKVAINTFHYRVYIMLAVSVVFSIVTWCLFYIGNVTYQTVRLNETSSSEVIEVCNAPKLVFLGFIEIVFSVVSFSLPAVIIIFNYWPIWKEGIKKATNTSRSRNVHIRMAVIMSLTVVEFFLFQLPLSAVVLITIYQRITGVLTLQSFWTSIGFGMWSIDCIINPLWITFLSSKSRRVTASAIRSRATNVVSTVSKLWIIFFFTYFSHSRPK